MSKKLEKSLSRKLEHQVIEFPQLLEYLKKEDAELSAPVIEEFSRFKYSRLEHAGDNFSHKDKKEDYQFHGFSLTQLLRHLLENFAKPPLKLLDVGAGIGRVCAQILKEFKDAVVVRGISGRSKEHIPGRDFINVGDVHYLSENKFFKDEKFDVIVCHRAATLANPVKVIEYLYSERLNTGGLFIISHVQILGIEGEAFIHLLECLRKKQHHIAWSPELRYNLDPEGLGVGEGTLIIKKTQNTPTLMLPVSPQKLIVKYVRVPEKLLIPYLQSYHSTPNFSHLLREYPVLKLCYHTTQSIPDSHLFDHTSSLRIEEGIALVCPYIQEDSSIRGVFYIEKQDHSKIKDIVAKLPKFSVLQAKLSPEEKKGSWDRINEQLQKSLYAYNKNNLIRFLEIYHPPGFLPPRGISKEQFTNFVILLVSKGLESEKLLHHYVKDCKKLGLPLDDKYAENRFSTSDLVWQKILKTSTIIGVTTAQKIVEQFLSGSSSLPDVPEEPLSVEINIFTKEPPLITKKELLANNTLQDINRFLQDYLKKTQSPATPWQQLKQFLYQNISELMIKGAKQASLEAAVIIAQQISWLIPASTTDDKAQAHSYQRLKAACLEPGHDLCDTLKTTAQLSHGAARFFSTSPHIIFTPVADLIEKIDKQQEKEEAEQLLMYSS